MKKLILMILMISIFICFPVFANEQVTICVNGVEMQTKGILKDDRTFVPIRFVAEGLGAQVKWSEDENTVYIYEQPDEVIPVSEWFDEEYDNMMQTAFETEGLDFRCVKEKTYFMYKYNDEKIYVEAEVFGMLDGKLLIRFYGEGMTEQTKQIYIGAFWYYDVKTGEFAKIGDGFYPFAFSDGGYIEERYTEWFYYKNTEQTMTFYNLKTGETHIMPQCEILAVWADVVYHTRLDGTLCVYDLKNGEEKEIVLKKRVKYIGAEGFCNGETLYVSMIGGDAEDMWTVNLKTWEVSQANYEKFEWLFDTHFFKMWQQKEIGNSEVGVPDIRINNKPMVDIPDAFLLNDRTYVPLRFIAEEMGAEVVWVDGENRVEINDKPSENPWYTFAEGGSPDIWVYN